jgi:hypothetical protein
MNSDGDYRTVLRNGPNNRRPELYILTDGNLTLTRLDEIAEVECRKHRLERGKTSLFFAPEQLRHLFGLGRVAHQEAQQGTRFRIRS